MKKGFTLIELLVVISIISLLSTIALASFKSARDKAVDAAIKSTLLGVRTQTEIYADNHGGSYGSNTDPSFSNCQEAVVGAGGGDMFADPDVKKLVEAAMALSPGSNTGNQPASAQCYSSLPTSPSWVMTIPLKSNSSLRWCVDSSKKSKQITGKIVFPVGGTFASCG